MTVTPSVPAAALSANRRFDFVKDLYALGSRRDSPIPQRAAEARKILAQLRRGLVGQRQQLEAYEHIFRHDPPQSEAETWLLIAGLFALHPKHTALNTDRTFGAPLGVLARNRKDSVSRRFTQLLGQNPQALPHYLRQCVQLAAQGDVAVDYLRLLEDVLVLTGRDHQGAQAHDIRFRWVRDFHRNAEPGPRRQTSNGTAEADESQEYTE